MSGLAITGRPASSTKRRTWLGVRQTLPGATSSPARRKRFFISDLRLIGPIVVRLMPLMLKSVRRRASVSSKCLVIDEVVQRSRELVVVGQGVGAVVVVERLTQLGPQLLPIRVGYAERGGPDFGEATHEPIGVARKVRRQEDDVQRRWSARSPEPRCESAAALLAEGRGHGLRPERRAGVALRRVAVEAGGEDAARRG